MSKVDNSPEIRFSGFQSKWEEKSLKDGTSNIGDGLHGTPKYINDSDIYFINGNNLIEGSIYITSDTNQVAAEELSKQDKTLNNKTILLSINGTIGNLAYYNGEKVMLGKSVAYITVADFNKNFTYIYLQIPRIRNYFNNNLTGSTIKNLGLKTIRETDIFAPEIPEQQKIGTYFKQIDQLITQKQKKYEKLQQLKKAMLHKMFPQNGATIPEIRFKGFDGEWEEKKLIKLAKITTGSSNREDSGLGGKYTFFDRSDDIRTSDIYLFDCEAVIVAGEGSDFIPKYFMGKFDLHQRTYAIINNEKCDGKFLLFYIYLFRRWFLNQAVGSTVKSLRLPMFQEMPIVLPKMKEQEKIGNYFKKLDHLISLQEKEISKLKNIKKALLEKMFV